MQRDISDHYTGVIRSNITLMEEKIEHWQQDIESQTAQQIVIEVKKLAQELREIRGVYSGGAGGNSATDETIHEYLARHKDDPQFMPATDANRVAFKDNVANRVEIERLKADVLEQRTIIETQQAMLDMTAYQ